jgi:hypothetical protein
MAITDLYPIGFHEEEIGHFATIVRLALLDNTIDAKEYELLSRLAKRLDISKLEFEAILNNPGNYPENPPISLDIRMERLFDLTKMMFLDKNPTIDKTSIMDRIAVGLGFPVEIAREVVKEAIQFFLVEPDVEDFKRSIKKVYSAKK